MAVSIVRVVILLLFFLFCGDVETCPPGAHDNYTSGFCKQRGLKIIHQNIRVLQTNFVLLQNLVQNADFDIVTLSETHLINAGFDDINNLYEIPNYTFIKRNREHGQGGGVAIYIKNNLKWERHFGLEVSSVESICLQILRKMQKVFS